MIWLCSDLHLGHTKMVELCGRPPEFSALIVDGILSHVKEKDTLICLGDVVVGNEGNGPMRYILSTLGTRNVQTILVRGNHDPRSIKAYLGEGWTVACDTYGFNMFGKSMIFTHVPLGGVDHWDVNIHGHTHNNKHRGDQLNDGKHILISMELLQYQPIPLVKALEIGTTPMRKNGRYVAYDGQSKDSD